jgi:hypothetical protein
MKPILTFIFVVTTCLLCGGLIGYAIGNDGQDKLIEQRDKTLKLVDVLKGLQDKTEKVALKCYDEYLNLRSVARKCCNAATQTLDQLDLCVGKKKKK